MSSLLPPFVSVQNGPHATGGGEAVSELFGQVSKDQVKPFGQEFAQAFSQVLLEHGDATVFLKHLQAFVSARSQQDVVSTLPCYRKMLVILRHWSVPKLLK